MLSLYALHGFLGKPDDWNSLHQALKYAYPDRSIDFKALELICPPRNSFFAWAQEFNQQAANNPRPKILLGYSLGGRLALHALLQAPSAWKAAIIVSANPGLDCDEMKAKRLVSDSIWANKFENEPWDRLMQQWNSQQVLATSQKIIRDETQFSRFQLSLHLKNWSLGLQKNLKKKLKACPTPILWAAGQKDVSFVNLIKDLDFNHELSKIWIAPNSGHRIPWDTPETFQSQVVQFIEGVMWKNNSSY